ncbi:MAG: hypothetical protein R2712_16400 [Vicinamibacterales bacterium]
MLATYFHRYRFRHPHPNDFFEIVNQESGQDLTWFFDEVYRSANVFDYAVERVESAPISTRGYVEPAPGAPLEFSEAGEPSGYRTTVVVRRIGEARFPVDVLVRFDNGEEVRERWDGQARWQPFVYEKPARVESAQVDPDRVLLLDVDYTNNSVTLAPQADAAADRWTLKWMVWLQDLLMTYSFFV